MDLSKNKVWDEKYANAQSPGVIPDFLVENRHLLPTSGSALDLACGLGACAIFLAGNGLKTQAWDNSQVALDKLANFALTADTQVESKLVNLETTLPVDQLFDVICVNHFLYRPLCEFIYESLVPGGLLFYQTWTRHKALDKGPSRPEFLLDDGELLILFNKLQPVAYREEKSIGDISRGQRNKAWLIAQKPYAK